MSEEKTNEQAGEEPVQEAEPNIVAENKKAYSGWGELDPDVEARALSPQEKSELKKKNYVVGAALVVFVALVFFVSIAKLSQNFGG